MEIDDNVLHEQEIYLFSFGYLGRNLYLCIDFVTC